MIDDIFVYDCAIHCIDMSVENTRGKQGEFGVKAMAAGAAPFRVPEAEAGVDTFVKAFSTEAMYDLVFARSPTDMAMAQAVPIFDWYEHGFAPVEAQHALAEAYPDRVQFCGGVDPNYHGDGVLEEIDRQITEMGAVSMKFYNGHVHESWRCDDEKVAYPMYQRIQDLGVNLIQFHKGIPFANQPLAPLNPLDIERAAIDFPDMNFVIHHMAMPYIDEAFSIAGRHPNVYLALSGTLNLLVFAPKLVQTHVGRMLGEVGVHKLLWGSEAALAGGPAPFLKAFMELEIPEDLRTGYAMPQITREDKERILGLNFAELMGIDVPAKRRDLGVAA
ncbi:MAG: amidohydrolase family protein [Solirubrobacteraceae bacterium]